MEQNQSKLYIFINIFKEINNKKPNKLPTDPKFFRPFNTRNKHDFLGLIIGNVDNTYVVTVGLSNIVTWCLVSDFRATVKK